MRLTAIAIILLLASCIPQGKKETRVINVGQRIELHDGFYASISPSRQVVLSERTSHDELVTREGKLVHVFLPIKGSTFTIDPDALTLTETTAAD